MDKETFMIEVENSHNRSKRVLLKKGEEYTLGKNRLDQFYRTGTVQAISPTSALVGMMAKHFTSISDMARDPSEHDIKKWNEKITDLRNYTYLLDALVRDMEDQGDFRRIE